MNIQFLKWELGEEFVIQQIPVSCMTITIQLEIQQFYLHCRQHSYIQLFKIDNRIIICGGATENSYIYNDPMAGCRILDSSTGINKNLNKMELLQSLSWLGLNFRGYKDYQRWGRIVLDQSPRNSQNQLMLGQAWSDKI